MLRWMALAALLAAGCVSAADAQERYPAGDFTLLNDTNSAGLWSDGITMWVVSNDPNPAINDKIFAYHMSNMSRYPGKDFVLHTENNNPTGIWSNHTTMWVADKSTSSLGDRIYSYRMSDRTYDGTEDFTNTVLNNAPKGNHEPFGIWSNGTIMWVSDQTDDQLFAYHMSPKSYAHSAILDQNTVRGCATCKYNNNPVGMWSDGTTMYVVEDDNDEDKVYAYNILNRSRVPDRDFDLHTSNTSPYGIWSNGVIWWVSDTNGDKIYAYKAPPSTPPSTPRVFVYVPPPDTTPPTIKSVERTGNATTTNHTLAWDVRFSESVRVGSAEVHTNYTSVANATIPDLGIAYDTMLVGVPGAVTGGSVSVDLQHPITSGLLIELVAPDCTKFTIHNQTTTFLYKLRQPYDLGDLSGVGAAGQWTLHVSDRAKYWNGTLNGWSLELESRGVVEGSGRTHTITQYVAGPGNYTLSLDGFDIRDRAGNRLVDTDAAVNEPYLVVGAAVRTCHTE